MLNAVSAPAPAPAPRGPSAQRDGRGSRRSGPSRGGISKRVGGRGLKVDKDGDLDMDSSARLGGPTRGGSSMNMTSLSRNDPRATKSTRASGSGSLRGGLNRQHTRGSGLIEIMVLGWQESKGNRDSVIDFIERRSGIKIKKV